MGAPLLVGLHKSILDAVSNMDIEHGFLRDYGKPVGALHSWDAERSPTRPSPMLIRINDEQREEGGERTGGMFLRFATFLLLVHIRFADEDHVTPVCEVEADLHRAIIQDRGRAGLPGLVNTFDDNETQIDYHFTDGGAIDGATVGIKLRVRYQHRTGDMSLV